MPAPREGPVRRGPLSPPAVGVPRRTAALFTLGIRIDARAGIRFDFRSLRRSFGQCALDRGVRYDTVSVLLGHKTTRTTETFYARRKYDQAVEELERVWT